MGHGLVPVPSEVLERSGATMVKALIITIVVLIVLLIILAIITKGKALEVIGDLFEAIGDMDFDVN